MLELKYGMKLTDSEIHCIISKVLNANFYPHQKDGKFGFKNGANKLSTEEFLGEEFKGFKGQDAVNKLLQEKRGHIKGAFTRSDIGDIDLVWGNDKLGLQHIIRRRKETKQDLQGILSSLTNIIENGKLSLGKKGRFQIELGDRKAIISLEYFKDKINFILTAFEKFE